MTATPKCPYCGSTDPLASVEQEHHRTTVLILYCSSCGAIVAAADLSAHYPDLGRRHAPATEAP